MEIVVINESFNVSDTVKIGFLPEATLGIDTELGENNISDLPPFGSLDVRVLQRDSLHYVCTYNDEENSQFVFFTNNFDSKINYRPYSSVESSNVFHIQVHSTDHFKTFLLKGDRELNSIIESLVISSDSCQMINMAGNSLNFTGKTYMINSAIEIKYITIIFKENIVHTSTPFLKEGIAVVPNPFKEQFTIDIKNPNVDLIEIYSAMGKKQIMISNDNKFVVDTHVWPSGFYFIKYRDKNSKIIGTKKIVKVD